MEKDRYLPRDRLPIVGSHCAEKITETRLVVPQFLKEPLPLINEGFCCDHVRTSCYAYTSIVKACRIKILHVFLSTWISSR